MTRLRVVVTATAEAHVRTIDRWWLAERSAAPDLFRAELEATLGQLTTAPFAGAPYPVAPLPGVRRVLLRRTRYHIYCTIHEGDGTLVVRAVWHTARGRGPPLE